MVHKLNNNIVLINNHLIIDENIIITELYKWLNNIDKNILKRVTNMEFELDEDIIISGKGNIINHDNDGYYSLNNYLSIYLDIRNEKNFELFYKSPSSDVWHQLEYDFNMLNNKSSLIYLGINEEIEIGLLKRTLLGNTFKPYGKFDNKYVIHIMV